MLKLDKNARLHGEPVRYVAMGDSFTEGVGDVDTDRPNQVRGWADRVAETIGLVDAQAQYANLAIRGLLMHQIVEQQLEAALELRPNLVSFYCCGNRCLNPPTDTDWVGTCCDVFDSFTDDSLSQDCCSCRSVTSDIICF